MAADCFLEVLGADGENGAAEDRRWVAAVLLAEGLQELGALRRALTKPAS